MLVTQTAAPSALKVKKRFRSMPSTPALPGHGTQAEDETGPEYGGCAMALDQIARRADVLVIQAENFLHEADKMPAQPAPQEVPDVVSHHGRADFYHDHSRQLQLRTLVGDEAGEHQLGFAGDGKARIFGRQPCQHGTIAIVRERVLNEVVEPTHSRQREAR